MSLVSDVLGAFGEEMRHKAEQAAHRKRRYELFDDYSLAFSQFSELSGSQNETKRASLFHCSYPGRIKAFYNYMALSSRDNTEAKIILSPDVLNALTIPEPYVYILKDPAAGRAIQGMAEKNFKLSLLFRNSAEMESPDGQEFMKILRENAHQNPAFADTLRIGVLEGQDPFLGTECEGFSVVENDKVHAYRFEFVNSEGRGAVGSLNRPNATANLSKGFDTLFDRAAPVKLNHCDM